MNMISLRIVMLPNIQRYKGQFCIPSSLVFKRAGWSSQPDLFAILRYKS